MVNLNADALAKFQQQAGPLGKSSKKTTKTKTTIHNKRPPAGYDCIKFECIHITPRTRHTFVFEATGNVPILTLKQNLSMSLNIPVDYLTLTMFDVELTHGTLNDCGVPEDSTLFITDEREDVSEQMEAMTNFDSENPLDAAFETDEDLKNEIRKARAKKQTAAPNFHDMLGGMPTKKPKKKKPAISERVQKQTRPDDIGAVDSQLVTILQKMSAGQLRKVAEKQGIKVSTWNKKALIEILVKAENQKKGSAGAPPAKPLPATTKERKKAYKAAVAPKPAAAPKPAVVKATPVKKSAPPKPKTKAKVQKTAAPAKSEPPSDLKYMSAKELRNLLTSMGVKPTSWNKSKLLAAVEEAQGSEPKVQISEPPKQDLPPPPKANERVPSNRSVAPPDDLLTMTSIAPPDQRLSTASSVAPPDDLASLNAPPDTREASMSDASVGGPPDGLDDLSAPPNAPNEPTTPPPPVVTQPPPPPVIKQTPPKPVTKAPPAAPTQPPPAPIVKKDPSKSTPAKKKGISGMAAKWDTKAKQAMAESKANPFSKHFDKSTGRKNLSKQGNKGMPVEGSLAWERMKKAQAWAKGKIDQLYVEIPKCPGAETHPDGSITCKFLSIFEHYAHIDSVITGTLKSAKKKGFCHYDNGRPFPLLQQTYDDDVIVTLYPRS